LLFIFDWDGTLCDSTGKITHAMQQAAHQLGWVIPEDHEVHNIIGLGLPEAVEILYPGLNATDQIRLRDAYRTAFLTLDERKPSVLFPTAQETLEYLRDQGHTLAIATGKSRVGLDRIISGMKLSGFFHSTRCADETASKPHPLMLEQLLGEFVCSPDEAVMIGDTEYDMDMARRISMPRIAVSYGAHAIERLHPYEPELCLDRLDDLLGWQRIVART
jgi:phosphoglycolate phosphatase